MANCSNVPLAAPNAQSQQPEPSSACKPSPAAASWEEESSAAMHHVKLAQAPPTNHALHATLDSF